MSPVFAVGSGTHWDDRRNTSQTRGPSPRALADALASCAVLRRNDPALVQWLEDGHPNLTEADHLARFGEEFGKRKKAA